MRKKIQIGIKLYINDLDRINVNVNILQMENGQYLVILLNMVSVIGRDYFKLDGKALELKNHWKIYDSLKEEDDRARIW